MTTHRLLAPALLFGAALLSACAADTREAAPAPVEAVSGPPPPGSLDGTYEGEQTPDGNPDCGFPEPIGFDVAASTISLRTHKVRRELGGGIDPYGRFTMTSTDGSRQIVGRVLGDHLVAHETAPPRSHHAVGEPVAGLVCVSQVDAHRIATEQ